MISGSRNYTIKEVLRALDLLEQFQPDIDELDVNKVCHILKIRKEKAVRLFNTLEAHNFVTKGINKGTYRLGAKVHFIGQSYARQRGLSKEARPAIEELARECNETVDLVVIKDSHMICIDSVESKQMVKVISRIGLRFPFHCTGPGKIHLAHMDEKQRSVIISSLEFQSYTPNTITSEIKLKKCVSKIIKNGFTVELEEYESGVCTLSAPVCDYTGSLIAVLSISLPSPRFSEQTANSKLIPLLIKSSNKLSAKLGHKSKCVSLRSAEYSKTPYSTSGKPAIQPTISSGKNNNTPNQNIDKTLYTPVTYQQAV